MEASTFDCAGVGNPTAAALLSKFYPIYPTLENIAVLASYVIYRVKSSVDGCGLETEIRTIAAIRAAEGRRLRYKAA